MPQVAAMAVPNVAIISSPDNIISMNMDASVDVNGSIDVDSPIDMDSPMDRRRICWCQDSKPKRGNDRKKYENFP